MTFEEKERLYDIKMSVQRRMEESAKIPRAIIPINIAKALHKQYSKKLDPLSEKIQGLWDEPNKRMNIQKKYDEIELFVEELTALINASRE